MYETSRKRYNTRTLWSYLLLQVHQFDKNGLLPRVQVGDHWLFQKQTCRGCSASDPVQTGTVQISQIEEGGD